MNPQNTQNTLIAKRIPYLGQSFAIYRTNPATEQPAAGSVLPVTTRLPLPAEAREFASSTFHLTGGICGKRDVRPKSGDIGNKSGRH